MGLGHPAAHTSGLGDGTHPVPPPGQWDALNSGEAELAAEPALHRYTFQSLLLFFFLFFVLVSLHSLP